jgi:hypothetical protein
MPGFMPGIHVLAYGEEGVDGQNKSGHDDISYFAHTT